MNNWFTVCFFDHFGPMDVSAGSMNVGPHPHIGLSTLTYLYQGAIVHRDSTGADIPILPGEVNLMTAGKGAAHSERGNEALSLISEDGGKKWLHGLQLWVALPKEQELCDPSFAHGAAEDLPYVDSYMNTSGNVSAKLVAGSLLGQCVSAIPEHWPMFMVDVDIKEGATLEFPIDGQHEAAIYASQGRVRVGAEGSLLDQGEAAVFVSSPGKNMVFVTAEEDSRIAIFGGLAFPEPRHIVWNYVSSDKKLIENAVVDWASVVRGNRTERFPPVKGEDNLDPIPMPDSFMLHLNQSKK